MSCFNSDLKKKKQQYIQLDFQASTDFTSSMSNFTDMPQMCKFKCPVIYLSTTKYVSTLLSGSSFLKKKPSSHHICTGLMFQVCDTHCNRGWSQFPYVSGKAVTLVYIWTQMVKVRTEPSHSGCIHFKGNMLGMLLCFNNFLQKHSFILRANKQFGEEHCLGPRPS